MLEKQLEAKVGRYAASRGVLYYKFTSPQRRGVPDRLLVAPNGHVGFLELKAPHGRLSALQIHEQARLRRNCVQVTTTDDFETAATFIDGLCR